MQPIINQEERTAIDALKAALITIEAVEAQINATIATADRAKQNISTATKLEITPEKALNEFKAVSSNLAIVLEHVDTSFLKFKEQMDGIIKEGGNLKAKLDTGLKMRQEEHDKRAAERMTERLKAGPEKTVVNLRGQK